MNIKFTWDQQKKTITIYSKQGADEGEEGHYWANQQGTVFYSSQSAVHCFLQEPISRSLFFTAADQHVSVFTAANQQWETSLPSKRRLRPTEPCLLQVDRWLVPREISNAQNSEQRTVDIVAAHKGATTKTSRRRSTSQHTNLAWKQESKQKSPRCWSNIYIISGTRATASFCIAFKTFIR